MASELKVTTINDGREGVLELRTLGYVDNLFQRLKGVGRFRYDKGRKCWVGAANEKTLQKLREEFRIVVSEESPDAPRTPPGKLTRPERDARRTSVVEGKTTSWLPEHWKEALHLTEEQLRVKRYSWRTVKSYLSHLRSFFSAHTHLVAKDIDNGTIRTYIVDRVRRGGYAQSTQGQLLNAIKFWLENVEGREKIFVDLRPKKEEKLPQVLSVEEVVRLFKSVENLKHRCILKMIYGGGLRLSELCALRIVDIHSDRMQVFVDGGKGKKDRYTTLSKNLLLELRAYFKAYKPSYWLFEGQSGGRYSTRSVQQVLRKAVKRSGVNPLATVHTLRHSYATHLLEQGVSLRHIQVLLGHNSSVTTERYTKVTDVERQRIVSPLDRLNSEEKD